MLQTNRLNPVYWIRRFNKEQSDVPKFDWLDHIRGFWNIIYFFFLFLLPLQWWWWWLVPRARSLALRLTLGVSLRLLPVPLLSPAEDGQGDEEQPDHHQEEAAQEDEEGGLQLLVSLELRALTAGREVSILFHQDQYTNFSITRASEATHCHWLQPSKPWYFTLISRFVFLFGISTLIFPELEVLKVDTFLEPSFLIWYTAT